MTVDIDPATGRQILLFEAFAYNGQYEVKATGFRGTAAAGVQTDLDFAIGDEDRYINGIHLILDQHNIADTVDLMIVDNDGIIPEAYHAAYPTWPILKQFGISWNVNHAQASQGKEIFNFVAKINAGLYLRIRYNSAGASVVDVKVNAFLHKKVA